MNDLAIIGGGPAGYVAAERAGANGLKTILFEKKELGGVCLNEGCIPTKTLLYSAKIYDYTKSGSKYGITVSDASFNYSKIVSRKNKVVRKLVLGIDAKMKNYGITVIKGEASIKGKKDDLFEIECGDQIYTAKNILICTGSETFIPPIKGLENIGDNILTNREILAMTEVPKSLVIIGGGVIGMEFASLYNSFGTEVTVIEMLPEILGNTDKEISAMLRDIYTKKGVKFHLSCKVTSVKDNEVTFESQNGETDTVTGEKILISVGRRAVSKGLGIENLNINTYKGSIVVDEKMRTNVEGVYAAGDVTGLSMLAHTASRQGEVAVQNILGINETMKYNAIPAIVYTNPEIASVGINMETATAQGLDVMELKLPMTFSGRFVAENEGFNGLCKIIAEKDSKIILGAQMIGNPCSEIIQGISIAIEQEMTIDDLKKVIFPHPTVSEIIKETISQQTSGDK